MSMEKQILYDRWLEIDGNQGIEFIQQELIGKTSNPSKKSVMDFIESTEIYDIRIIDGYGARLSMPGYLDCTEWTVFETQEQAENYLNDLTE